MSFCIFQNLEKYRVLWTNFSASSREINWFSVSKIGPQSVKPMISLALMYCNMGQKTIVYNQESVKKYIAIM